MSNTFWTNDPYILFNKNYIFDIWPSSKMTYAEKLNAVSRLILVITIVGFVGTSSIRVLIVGLVTLGAIYLLYNFHQKKENFYVDGDNVYELRPTNPNNEVNASTNLSQIVQNEFKEGNKKNPFSNVLLTQINDEPNRLAAPPAFNPNIEEKITKDIKKSVQFMNPDISNTNKQLFDSLWDNFTLDNSNRVFYSTPNTRVANDQGAYAKFLYGSMPSAKGSTMEDNIQREKDNYRYTLY